MSPKQERAAAMPRSEPSAGSPGRDDLIQKSHFTSRDSSPETANRHPRGDADAFTIVGPAMRRNPALDAALSELAAYGIKPEVLNRKKHLMLVWTWRGRMDRTVVHRTPSTDWHAGINKRAEI